MSRLVKRGEEATNQTPKTERQSKWINFLSIEVQRWDRKRGGCEQIYVTEHIYQGFQNPVLENQMPRPFGKQLQECVTNYLDVLVYLSNNSSCYKPCQLACLLSPKSALLKLIAIGPSFFLSHNRCWTHTCILKNTTLYVSNWSGYL